MYFCISSDVNWWRGSTSRGEGLFPANFVTADLNAEAESKCTMKIMTTHGRRTNELL